MTCNAYNHNELNATAGGCPACHPKASFDTATLLQMQQWACQMPEPPEPLILTDEMVAELKREHIRKASAVGRMDSRTQPACDRG